MPSQAPTTDVRLNNITACFSVTTNTIEILAVALKAPFLEAIANATRSLLKKFQVNFRKFGLLISLREAF
jgi:hypothetical protein